MMDPKSLSVEDPTATYPFIPYKDWVFMPTPAIRTKGPEKHFQDIHDYETRESDIILCSSQKSGTHWIHEIMSMLMKQTTEYNSLGPWWELNLEYLRQPEEVKKITGPRIFSTHLPFSFLPRTHVDNGHKIVYLNRNLKDRYVSLYTFLQGKLGVPKWTWAEFFDDFVLEDNLYTGWFNYTKEMIAATKNKSNKIFSVMYEDLLSDPKKHITDLANFLEVPYTDEFINDIVIKCSFKNLKDHKLDVCSIIDTDKKSTLFRKGLIGDWKNWFTVSQNEIMEAIYNKEMRDVDVKFKYE
ncbi:sulfotransferase 1B1-like [Mytilus trossulus]|uniref:sulfotransferase 1B1-like n=1 Tax=Mytilus trossulus TaxID=6551 RepID=UPI003006E5B9